MPTALPAPNSRSADISKYQLAADQTAIRALQAVPVLPQVVSAFIQYWEAPLHRAELLGGAVRCGAGQFQSLHRPLEKAARALGVRSPELYVKSDPFPNAYTLGTNEDHVIVVHSALVDLLAERELAFILAHELGHVLAGHVVYLTVAHAIAKGIGSVVGGFLTAPLRVPLDALAREAELTADRIGLWGCGDLEASVRSIALLGFGTRKLLPEFNLEEFLRQEDGLHTAYGYIQRIFGGNDHPHLTTRAKRLLEFARDNPDLILAPLRTATESGTGNPSESRYLSPPAGRFCRTCGFEMSGASCLVCD